MKLTYGARMSLDLIGATTIRTPTMVTILRMDSILSLKTKMDIRAPFRKKSVMMWPNQSRMVLI